MRLTILCRGSTAGGLGHFFRAHRFAMAAMDRHELRLIAIGAADHMAVFEGLGHCLHRVPDETGALAAIRECPPDTLVLDLVHLEPETIAALRALVPSLISLSPIFNGMQQLDMLITRGAVPAGLTGVEVHSGAQYAIFSAYCRPIPEERFRLNLNNPVLPVAISMGGGDADNHTRLLLEAALTVPTPCLFWVLVGDAYPHSIDELVRSLPGDSPHEIVVARTRRSMWEVLNNCALGILSSGLSTMEAIHAGLPVIGVLRQGDPSRLIHTAYDQLCLDGGAFIDGSYRRISSLLTGLHTSREQIAALRQAEAGILDGQGAERSLRRIEERFERERGYYG